MEGKKAAGKEPQAGLRCPLYMRFALLALACCLWMPACHRRTPLLYIPAATGTVRTIRVASAPEGTAADLVSLWKSRGIDFGVGRAYTEQGARQAMLAAREHYRKNRLSKRPLGLEVQERNGALELTIR